MMGASLPFPAKPRVFWAQAIFVVVRCDGLFCLHHAMDPGKIPGTPGAETAGNCGSLSDAPGCWECSQVS